MIYEHDLGMGMYTYPNIQRQEKAGTGQSWTKLNIFFKNFGEKTLNFEFYTNVKVI